MQAWEFKGVPPLSAVKLNLYYFIMIIFLIFGTCDKHVGLQHLCYCSQQQLRIPKIVGGCLISSMHPSALNYLYQELPLYTSRNARLAVHPPLV